MIFNEVAAAVVTIPVVAYLCYVRGRRYERARKISRQFGSPERPLSSMTLKEAYAIIEELQTLEFPTAFDKGRAYALLKVMNLPHLESHKTRPECSRKDDRRAASRPYPSS